MRRATLFSLCAGMILVALKTGAWLFTDSLSMMSSLADSLLDVMASALNFVAVRYSLQPPDHEHRFGHGKAEELASLAQSTFICGSGVFLVVAGIKRLIVPQAVTHHAAGLGVMAFSILLTLALVLYQRRVAKLTRSSAITADAMHYYIDLLTNLSVIGALIVTAFTGWQSADPVVAICVALYIIWSALSIGLKAFHNLMDREFSDEERQDIVRLVKENPHVAGLHELRTRKSGIYRFIQFHLEFDGDMSLRHVHEISDAVEETLRAAFPHTDIIIHQDPVHARKKRTAF